jgi:hypothetical protein
MVARLADRGDSGDVTLPLHRLKSDRRGGALFVWPLIDGTIDICHPLDERAIEGTSEPPCDPTGPLADGLGPLVFA